MNGGGERTDVPALGEYDAHEEEDQERGGADPAVGGVGGGFVEEGLVALEKRSVRFVLRMAGNLRYSLL